VAPLAQPLPTDYKALDVALGSTGAAGFENPFDSAVSRFLVQETPVDFFDAANDLYYGDVHLKHDPETGLSAIVAIHSLELGPAIGGCRLYDYSDSNAAIRDALRLGRGMSYKAAISNLPHGGGKSVIIKPPNLDESTRRAMFARFGQFVDSLGGQYITSEDVGTRVEDMNVIHEQTDHVLGFDPDAGSSGDPSPFTAFGVRRGIEAAVQFEWGRDTLDGLHVAIQGVGSVGYYLAEELHELGCELTVTDIDDDAVDRCVEEFGATRVEPDEIYSVDCDIFAPCAMGGAINDDTVDQLECDIVAGSANNQLAEARHGVALRERGILYGPDYAVNAGGLINVAQEYRGYDAQTARKKASHIYDTVLEILERADRENLSTNLVANRIVEERLYGKPLQ